MKYRELLVRNAEKSKSIVCLGLDPVIERIPVEGESIRTRLVTFFSEIFNEAAKRNILLSTVKPNYAFYAQYGFDGLYALKEIIELCTSAGVPVILDAKRGDIGATSAAYAKECFDFFNADAVTVAPYMGLDSVSPFFDGSREKGVYVLCRTSNKSARDVQDLFTNEGPVFERVAQKIMDWGFDGLGAVVGATYVEELDRVQKIFNSGGSPVPLLIPGVGTQGGDVKSLCAVLKKWGNTGLHRINSSSGILYAHEKRKGVSYSVAAIDELCALNDQINEYLI